MLPRRRALATVDNRYVAAKYEMWAAHRRIRSSAHLPLYRTTSFAAYENCIGVLNGIHIDGHAVRPTRPACICLGQCARVKPLQERTSLDTTGRSAFIHVTSIRFRRWLGGPHLWFFRIDRTKALKI